MDLQSIFVFFNKLKTDNFSFIYHGFMSDEFTEKIISLSEHNIEKISDSRTIKNKVSFLIAESFQNIIRHGESFEDEKYQFSKPGIFIFRNIKNSFLISSANLINNKNIESISKQLSKINSLDNEELKILYQELIQNDQISEKGGAGLGLIEMARKTGNKLIFDFEKINENYSLFYLQIKFNPISDSEEDNTQNVTTIKEFYDSMIQNNSYLSYNGDFSQENVLTLLKIIERNLKINQFEHESLKSLVFIILTELLQNISKHAHEINNIKEGVFLLGKYFNNYVISTGNYILNKYVLEFEKLFVLLQKMDKKDLQILFTEKLKTGSIDKFGNAGLGLIEIAKESSEIKHNLIQINSEYSFLTLSIKI